MCRLRENLVYPNVRSISTSQLIPFSIIENAGKKIRDKYKNDKCALPLINSLYTISCNGYYQIQDISQSKLFCIPLCQNRLFNDIEKIASKIFPNILTIRINTPSDITTATYNKYEKIFSYKYEIEQLLEIASSKHFGLAYFIHNLDKWYDKKHEKDLCKLLSILERRHSTFILARYKYANLYKHANLWGNSSIPKCMVDCQCL